MTCPICNYEWTPTDKGFGHKAKGELQVCATCIYLEMARRHANLRRISLRKAVCLFLKATAAKEGMTMQEVWRNVSNPASDAFSR